MTTTLEGRELFKINERRRQSNSRGRRSKHIRRMRYVRTATVINREIRYYTYPDAAPPVIERDDDTATRPPTRIPDEF